MKKYRNNFFKLSLLFLAIVFSLSSFGSGPVVADIKYIYLYKGLELGHKLPDRFKKEKRLTFAGNYKRYTSVVYKKSNNTIRFQPKRVGSAMVIIKNNKNEIIGRLSVNVQKDNLHKIAAELRDLLITVDGIEVKIYNKKVIIDGQVLLPQEMDRVKAVIRQYNPKLVQSLVTYSPEAQKKIAEIMETEIGYPEVTVRYAYNRFLLEGCVSGEEEKIRALKIANLYTQFEVSAVGDNTKRKGVAVVQDNVTFPCESGKKEEDEKKQLEEVKKLIQIVVHFVEMEKNFDKGFLFQWTPAIGDSGTQVTASLGNNPQIPSGITSALTATIGNFFPKLNWAKSFNFARVLHNSSLLVEEGANGTISIKTSAPTSTVVNGQVTSSPSTQAEVVANVQPSIIGERKNLIKMQVRISVTSPGSEGTVTRMVDTLVHVRDGASAVIGGIISSFLNRSYNKAPASVNAQPILNLLSQKGYGAKKSQFVMFITPLVKSSSSIGVERIKRKFKLNE